MKTRLIKNYTSHGWEYAIQVRTFLRWRYVEFLDTDSLESALEMFSAFNANKDEVIATGRKGR